MPARKSEIEDVPQMVMASMTEDHALREAHLLILRQVHTQLENLNEKLEKVGDTIANINERLIRIESSGIAEQIASVKDKASKLEDRINQLEADRDARSGAAKFLEWIWRFGPWLAAIITAVVLVLRGRQ